jgi:hypothetical protein
MTCSYCCILFILSGSWFTLWTAYQRRVRRGVQLWCCWCCKEARKAWYCFSGNYPSDSSNIKRVDGTVPLSGTCNVFFLREGTCNVLVFFIPFTSKVCLFFQKWPTQDSIERILCVPLKRANEIIGTTTEELVIRAQDAPAGS